jgi:isoamylase
VKEFKDHGQDAARGGLEVILDVVYNHTSEGNHMGPTLSFKGIDNPTYYRLVPTTRATTSTTRAPATPELRHPQTLQLVMDSLRYWVLEMHVDGFRFDLAARWRAGCTRWTSSRGFFTIIHQDPVLAA